MNKGGGGGTREVGVEHWRLGWKQEGGNKTGGGGMKEGGWGRIKEMRW